MGTNQVRLKTGKVNLNHLIIELSGIGKDLGISLQ